MSFFQPQIYEKGGDEPAKNVIFIPSKTPIMPQTTLEEIISRQLQIALPRVEGAVRLLREGASIPFISRYRKEATGSLDEVQVAAIREQLECLTELEARKRTILETIQSQGALTDELRRRIEECWEAAPLEDLYLPYRPKRRTRATIARERGLEPLANLLQGQRTPSLEREARRFVTAEVPTVEEALAGACDIAAERMAEDDHARAALRRIFAREGVIRSRVVRGKEEAGVKYADYFDASAPCAASPRTAIWPCAAARRRVFCVSGSKSMRSAAPESCAAASSGRDQPPADGWRRPSPMRSSG